MNYNMKFKVAFSSIILIFYAFLAGGSISDDFSNGFLFSLYMTIGLFIVVFISYRLIKSYNTNKRNKLIKADEEESNDFNRSVFIGDDRCRIYFDLNKKQIMIMRVMTEGINKEYIENFEIPDTSFAKYLSPDFYIYDPVSRRLLSGKYDGLRISYEIKCITKHDENRNVVVNNKIKPTFNVLKTWSAPGTNVFTLIDECHGLIVTAESGQVKNIFNYVDANNLLDKKGDKTTIEIKNIGSYSFIMDNYFNIIIIITSNWYKVFNYSDIINVSYEENGKQLYSKSSGRTVGGAIVGGMLMGGAGAVVGALSGGSKVNKEVTEMNVKIVLRSTSQPTCILQYNDAKKNLNTKNDIDNQLYTSYLKNAIQAKDLLSVIIDKSDNKNIYASPINNQNNGKITSVADELMKLAKLKSDGILTEEEFQAQKAKLLK